MADIHQRYEKFMRIKMFFLEPPESLIKKIWNHLLYPKKFEGWDLALIVITYIIHYELLEIIIIHTK
jgi:hypothetical protein